LYLKCVSGADHKIKICEQTLGPPTSEFYFVTKLTLVFYYKLDFVDYIYNDYKYLAWKNTQYLPDGSDDAS